MLASNVARLNGAAVLRRCSRYGLNPLRRNFTRSAVLSDDDLPYHIVVGMPALSPTMETGILSEWYVEEGGGFSAGESIAKIETDKASIDFEAQDDGFVGKLYYILHTYQNCAGRSTMMMYNVINSAH